MAKVVPCDTEIACKICDAIANGQSFRKTCKDFNVEFNSFYEAIHLDENLAKRFTRAQQLQMQTLKASIMDEVNNADASYGVYISDDGKPMVNSNYGVVLRTKLECLAKIRGGLIGAKLKGLKNAKTAEEILNITQAAVEDQILTIDEAATLAKLAEIKLRAVEVQELGKKVDTLMEKK